MTRSLSDAIARGRLARLAFLAPALLGLAAYARAEDAAAAAPAPAYEKEVYLLYTVNNFGYTNVCG